MSADTKKTTKTRKWSLREETALITSMATTRIVDGKYKSQFATQIEFCNDVLEQLIIVKNNGTKVKPRISRDEILRKAKALKLKAKNDPGVKAEALVIPRKKPTPKKKVPTDYTTLFNKIIHERRNTLTGAIQRAEADIE